MANDASKIGALETRCAELEVTCRIWIAANEAKDHRILELEAECKKLQSRVGRLGRRVGREKKETKVASIQFAR